MPRLFVAVWPPDDVLDLLAALPRPEIKGLRWTGREQWHVTLRFLGSVAEQAPVVEALRALDFAVAPAVLGPAVGRFGRRILHVPVAGLDAIAASVVAVTSGLGEPPDDRPFSGHVTLARVARDANVDVRPLAGAPIDGGWAARSVCLVESRLTPAGARYEVLEEFALLGAAQGGDGP